MKGHWASSGLVGIALAALSGSARAQDAAQTNAECARAYEQAQVERKAGELIAARSTLQTCARDECPEFIRTDCSAWYVEVQEEVPTLVFAARHRGRDLSEVRISTGRRLLAARSDGQVVELDPGQYDFEFLAPDMRPQTQHVVIARGERNRLIQVELEPVTAAEAVAPRPAPARPPRSRLLPAVFGGVGVLGIAGFAGLGAWGRTQENELEGSCAPGCAPEQVSQLRTKYLLADVSLGVGVASLALGAYFFLTGETQPQARALRSPVAVRAAPGSASVVYGSTF